MRAVMIVLSSLRRLVGAAGCTPLMYATQGQTPASQCPSSSLDDLVSPRQKRRRHCEPKGAGGFEVDDELKLCWRLHGKVSRLLAPEDAVNITGCLSKLVKPIRSVRNHPPPTTLALFAYTEGSLCRLASAMICS